jgi:hypothetical protein
MELSYIVTYIVNHLIRKHIQPVQPTAVEHFKVPPYLIGSWAQCYEKFAECLYILLR